MKYNVRIRSSTNDKWEKLNLSVHEIKDLIGKRLNKNKVLRIVIKGE